MRLIHNKLVTENNNVYLSPRDYALKNAWESINLSQKMNFSG